MSVLIISGNTFPGLSRTSWAHFQWQLDFYLTKHVTVDYIQDIENFHLKQIFVISCTEKATKKKAVKTCNSCLHCVCLRITTVNQCTHPQEYHPRP